MSNKALFSVNLDSTNQGFDGATNQALSFKLRAPAVGVRTWELQVFSAAGFDSSLSIAQNPPRQSPGAPELTLVGATTGKRVSPVSLTSAITTTLPGTDFHGWIVRSIVDGGRDGRGRADPSRIAERLIVIRNGAGNRPVVVTETTQYSDEGWVEALNEGLGNISLDSDAVSNESGVSGASVSDALDSLASSISSLGSDDIGNDSGVSGATVSDALDTLDAQFDPATGSATGYLSRIVYVNASSTKLGTTFAGVTTQAVPASWTTSADVPPGSEFIVDCAGGGAGGSAGSGSSGSGGGPGGGGGARARRHLLRSTILDALPIAMTCELGGTGGVQNAGNGNKIAGVAGGDAKFGTLVQAYGGGAGGGGAVTCHQGGGGGGIHGKGVSSTTSNAGIPGGLPANTTSPNTTLIGENDSGLGGAGVLDSTGLLTSERARCSVWGGASGGSTRTNGATSNAGGQGGRSSFGGGGGGCGGSHGSNAANTAAGGAGGKSGGDPAGSAVGGGAAGGAGSSTTPGAPGSDGADGNADHNGDGGGGGGSAGQVTTGVGGAGGAGGFPGGGGGGGGSIRTGAAGENPGDGGKGGDCMIMITVVR